MKYEVRTMKISTKGRYGLAAMTHLAMNYGTGQPVAIINISEKLGISKIYLEQVFSLLKRARLVTSLKGAQGGYQLARQPKDINVYDILSAIEISLIEPTDATTSGHHPELEHALQSVVFQPLDNAIKTALSAITLENILAETQKQMSPDNLMYFI